MAIARIAPTQAVADIEIPTSLAKLIASNPCGCGRVYDLIRCSWKSATHKFAVGCPICQELVAESDSIYLIEFDFRQHLARTAMIPF